MHGWMIYFDLQHLILTWQWSSLIPSGNVWMILLVVIVDVYQVIIENQQEDTMIYWADIFHRTYIFYFWVSATRPLCKEYGCLDIHVLLSSVGESATILIVLNKQKNIKKIVYIHGCEFHIVSLKVKFRNSWINTKCCAKCFLFFSLHKYKDT